MIRKIGRIAAWSLLVLSPLAVSAQQGLSGRADQLLRAKEAHLLQSPVGVLRDLAPKHSDFWQLPGNDEEATYLDAIARGALMTPDADLRLLHFIESHPHSAYLPHAQARLGECYYIRGMYDSASYWFGKVDTALLPEEVAEAVDYYHAYSLLKVGRESRAIRIFRPLTFSKTFGEDAAFYLGYILMKQGDFRESIQHLERVEHHKTYGAYATAYLAEALLSESRYSESLQKASGRLSGAHGLGNKVRASLLRTAGLAATNLGDPKSATSYLRDYFEVAQTPGQIEYLTMGKGLFDLGQYQDANTYLLRVAEGGEQNFMSQLALYYAGVAQLSLQKPQEALHSFDRAVQINAYPQLTEAASYNAALAAYSQAPGKLSDGSARLARFLSQFPSSEYRSQVIGHLSDAFLNEPNVQASLQEMDKISPLPAELRRTRERVRLREANISLESGQTTVASRQYDDIIKRGDDPVSVAEAYLWKGEAAYRNGDYNTAISSTLSYLSSRPRELELNPSAYFTLGYAYFNQRKYADAERALNQFLREKDAPSPDERTDVYNRLGDIAVQQNRYADAQRLYQQAEQAGGTEADYAYFSQGMMRGLQQDYRGKVEILSRLATRFPQSSRIPEALYEQGRTLALLGDNAGARAVFERFNAQYQHNEFAPKVGNQLALSYFNDNRLEEAARTYEQVIRNYPNTPEARSALLNLKGISVELNEVDRFNQLVKQAGGSVVVTSAEMDSLTYLAAERLITQGTTAEATRAMDDYLRQYPNGAFANRARYSQALLYYNAGNYSEVLRSLEPLTRTASGELARDVFNLKANAHDKAGEPGRAAEAFVQLARAETNNADRSNAIRAAVDRAKKSNSHDFVYGLAADVANGAFAINDQAKSEVYATATESYARSNQKSQALAFANRLLALPDFGHHTMANVVKGLSLYDEGKYAEVQQMMQKIATIGSTDPYWLARAFILLADTYSAQGDKATAKTYLESVQNSYRNASDGILELVRDRLAKL